MKQRDREATLDPPKDPEEVVERVRQRYGEIARSRGTGCCPGADDARDDGAQAHRIGYRDEELETVPEGANLGLGCGAPIPLLDLQEGETVLDLGSGGGLDAFLAARLVGPRGKVIGVDMTSEMVERAKANAERAGLGQVEFRLGRLEALPVADASVDAVTSNCVINLVPDKARVFGEIARVLRPGGRLVVADIVLDGRLPEVVERNVTAWIGCVAGAAQRDEYFATVERAGLTRIEILRDVDALGLFENALPQDVRELVERLGIDVDALRGKARSITFRATRAD